jgi:hypothetical protein
MTTMPVVSLHFVGYKGRSHPYTKRASPSAAVSPGLSVAMVSTAFRFATL